MQAICFRKATYQLEGLTVAIIVVFELPPRESCQKNIHKSSSVD
jgi:hypothetical protein